MIHHARRSGKTNFVLESIKKENEKYPTFLKEVVGAIAFAGTPKGVTKVMRSRDFIVQIYENEKPGITRLTINRTACYIDGSGKIRYEESITWDELQRLKNEAGYGDLDAVEVFPRDCDVVNVANMRHLWVIHVGLCFAWRKGQ